MTPSGGASSGANRGFQQYDPQKRLDRGGASSGGNFADEPEPATPDQLRDAIDHGETGDKVNARDPAAAPLGTDAEAGGASNLPIKTPEDAADVDQRSAALSRRPKLPT
jgi:hypothetical protein